MLDKSLKNVYNIMQLAVANLVVIPRGSESWKGMRHEFTSIK